MTDQEPREAESHNAVPSDVRPGNSIFTSDAVQQRQPKNVGELFAAKEHETPTIPSSTSASHNTVHEKAFGTNLTTGRREYLSQYPKPDTATESVDDGEESVASRSTQDDTFSTDSSMSGGQMSTFYTDSSLSRDVSDLDDSDSTLGTNVAEDVDIY